MQISDVARIFLTNNNLPIFVIVKSEKKNEARLRHRILKDSVQLTRFLVFNFIRRSVAFTED